MKVAAVIHTAEPSRLHPADLISIGAVGIRSRRPAILTAAGIAIGIAAMVAVLAISNEPGGPARSSTASEPTSPPPGNTIRGQTATLSEVAPR